MVVTVAQVSEANDILLTEPQNGSVPLKKNYDNNDVGDDWQAGIVIEGQQNLYIDGQGFTLDAGQRFRVL